ncbi:MAG: LysM peptidoglycan-binding domain-containing M23 family metallopeptidase [Pseudomonadota bacterium]|nr:LysM peptidoglycan-binding domain-containing M23 family metallopeptidase [Pseudomonadota bacterium]
MTRSHPDARARALPFRPTAALPALAFSALVAGCGGGGGDYATPASSGPSSPPPSRSAPASSAATDLEAATPDSRGVIVRPDYAAIIARSGDTVPSMASRVGVSASELAAYNGLPTSYLPKPGDELVLPPRDGGYGSAGAYSGGQEASLDSLSSAPVAAPLSEAPAPQPVPADALASAATPPAAPSAAGASADGWSPALVEGALNGADATPSAGASAAGGGNPNAVGYHDVKSGETVYSIARTYGVSPEALITWNALSGPSYSVNPGQVLVIPSSAAAVGGTATVTAPGVSSDAPPPPSAGAPLPRDTVAAKPLESPQLQQYQTDPVAPPAAPSPTPTEIASAPAPAAEQPAPRAAAAPAPGKFLKPVSGAIVAKFNPGGGSQRNDGVDFAASAGEPVRAAGDGTVALVSKSLGEWGNIVLVRHAGDLMTVYSRMGDVAVAKGAPVRAGDVLGDVAPGQGRAATLHFEVRRGAFSEDPAKFF